MYDILSKKWRLKQIIAVILNLVHLLGTIHWKSNVYIKINGSTVDMHYSTYFCIGIIVQKITTTNVGFSGTRCLDRVGT
jgi:hypothetical protein